MRRFAVPKNFLKSATFSVGKGLPTLPASCVSKTKQPKAVLPPVVKGTMAPIRL
jgi:hypothetical protein